jgi:hypothetical protein
MILFPIPSFLDKIIITGPLENNQNHKRGDLHNNSHSEISVPMFPTLVTRVLSLSSNQ